LKKGKKGGERASNFILLENLVDNLLI
jgi:SUMO ligase MMS21 Smc5/6 complex component